MSAVEAERETTRYEGLIRTAQELFDAHEQSGWRLANVIYDAVEDLRHGQGMVIKNPGKAVARISACRQVALDLDRHRMSAEDTIYRHYLTWKRWGDISKRHPTLPFNDHVALTHVSQKGQGTAVSRLKQRRAAMSAGEKSKYANATHAISRSGPAWASLHRLGNAKSGLRFVLKSNVWDYPDSDRQKVLDQLAEIQALLDQVKAKPWSPEGGES